MEAMYEVPIPDHVYQQATQAAAAQHVSVEEFISEAVQLRLKDSDLTIQEMFTLSDSPTSRMLRQRLMLGWD